jgi:hypothetical protein
MQEYKKITDFTKSSYYSATLQNTAFGIYPKPDVSFEASQQGVTLSISAL